MIRTGLLVRLFGQDTRHGGQASASTALVAEAAATEEAAVSRRHRWLPLPGEVVEEVLAGKVLHAWLQNQHQTLYPLTVNLRTLDAGRAGLLARMMALTVLAGAAPPSAERVEEGVRWLAQAGGSRDVEEAFRVALGATDPLRVLLHEIQAAGMAAYAYVVALAVTDPRDEAGQIFLDYLAARLALPANVVRSADRRYRGLSRPYDRAQSSAPVRPVSAP